MSSQSALHRRVFIVGGAVTPFIGKRHPDFIWEKHSDFGKKTNPDLEQILRRTIEETFSNTKVPPSAIDKGFLGNFAAELFSSQGHLGAAAVGACPELLYKPFSRVEAACASGGMAFYHAVEALQIPKHPEKSTGANVCLVLGVEQQTTVSPREGANFLARAAHYSQERAIDEFTFPALFARRTKAYMQEYGATFEDISRVSVKAYSNANKNPKAHMQAVHLSLEQARSASPQNPQFLKNEHLAPFLRVSDCSQVSDGGAGLILANEEGLAALGLAPSQCIEVLTSVLSTGSLYDHPSGSGDSVDPSLATLSTTQHAAQQAFSQTKLKPEQIDIAEVHDCFAVAELMMIEALGICNHGEAFKLLKNGAFEISAPENNNNNNSANRSSSGNVTSSTWIPVNTGGGLIGFGHPVGATGLKQVLEVCRQMRGECGEYQVKGKQLVHGICANMGGSDKTCVVTILKNNQKSNL